MNDQYSLVPDVNELKQVRGTLLVGRRKDTSLIPVLIDANGELVSTSGLGNDYSGMSDIYRLVPDANPLKQVPGSLLVGMTADGKLLPIAVDDEGRVITSGGLRVINTPGVPDTPGGTLPEAAFSLVCGTLSFWDPDLLEWIPQNPEKALGKYDFPTTADLQALPTLDGCPLVHAHCRGWNVEFDGQSPDFDWDPGYSGPWGAQGIVRPADRVGPDINGAWRQTTST